MANNRMYLRVKDHPEKKILLAKYYPSTGWYIFHDEETLNAWFKENFNYADLPKPEWVDGQWGRTDLELEFETSSVDKEITRQSLSDKGENG